MRNIGANTGGVTALQGATGDEMWLGVELCKRRAAVTGWVQSGELQRGVAKLVMVAGWQGWEERAKTGGVTGVWRSTIGWA